MNDTGQFKAIILVIESDSGLREGIGAVLELEGYRVLYAETGTDGLQQAQQRPDLIVCAFTLPGFTGDTTLAALQASPETAAIPVIWTRITSAHRDPVGKVYLNKPFAAEDLLALVEASLKVD